MKRRAPNDTRVVKGSTDAGVAELLEPRADHGWDWTAAVVVADQPMRVRRAAFLSVPL
jgi:hypothetical protein